MAEDRRRKTWTTKENEKLVQLIKNGASFAEAAKTLGRTPKACYTEYAFIAKGKDNVRPRLEGEPKQSLSACWICKKAGHCEKPVEGWDIETHESTYYAIGKIKKMELNIVKFCPRYDPDDYLDKYDTRRFYHGGDHGKKARPCPR